MKENSNGENLNGENLVSNVAVEENTSPEFQEKLGVIKDKFVKSKNLEQESIKLRYEVQNLANTFVKEFSVNKVELGKLVSWIGDQPNELISILENSLSGEIGNGNILDVELNKVPQRLNHGLMRPESYTSDRVNNLVNVLNTYDNYIDTFESIELSDDDNCLDENKYLIDHNLHNLLINGYKLKRDRTINKSVRGFYVVAFKTIKVEGEESLIYKYIFYPYIFADLLYSYFIRESSSLVVRNGNSVGTDYLFVIENQRYSEEFLLQRIKDISECFKLKGVNRDSRSIYPRNIIDLFKILLKGCPIFLNKDNIAKFIELSAQRNIFDIMVSIIKMYNFYGKNEQNGLILAKEKLDKMQSDNYNLLGRLIFVTEDLDSLINKLKGSFDGSVNQGPQKWRGQSDSLSNTINSIDSDFRKSMNCHNQYHVNMGNIPRKSLIGRSKFSYQNIHLNLGNVRYPF
jgi:hypothetical protein